MARPIKKGLDYFPFDVDFFSDRKIKRLRAKFGTDGLAVYIYLLCEIYRSGYYININDDLILDISDEVNISDNLTRHIIDFLLSRSLFNDTLAKSDKVLTAESVQRRYQEARKGSKREVEVEAGYWLLKADETYSFIKVRINDSFSEKNPSYSKKNPSYSEKNSIKESKENKSKVNESKGDEPSGSAHSPKPQKHKYGEYNNVLLTDEEVEKLKSQISDYQGYIERLSGYIESKGAKYKSHYATIRNWYSRDMKSGKVKDKSEHSYDLDEFESFTMNYVPKIGGEGQ